MSDITTIVSSMGGFQAATPQDQDAVEALLGSRGGRQRSGGTPTPTPPSLPANAFFSLFADDATTPNVVRNRSEDALPASIWGPSRPSQHPLLIGNVANAGSTSANELGTDGVPGAFRFDWAAGASPTFFVQGLGSDTFPGGVLVPAGTWTASWELTSLNGNNVTMTQGDHANVLSQSANMNVTATPQTFSRTFTLASDAVIRMTFAAAGGGPAGSVRWDKVRLVPGTVAGAIDVNPRHITRVGRFARSGQAIRTQPQVSTSNGNEAHAYYPTGAAEAKRNAISFMFAVAMDNGVPMTGGVYPLVAKANTPFTGVGDTPFEFGIVGGLFGLAGLPANSGNLQTAVAGPDQSGFVTVALTAGPTGTTLYVNRIAVASNTIPLDGPTLAALSIFGRNFKSSFPGKVIGGGGWWRSLTLAEVKQGHALLVQKVRDLGETFIEPAQQKIVDGDSISAGTDGRGGFVSKTGRLFTVKPQAISFAVQGQGIADLEGRTAVTYPLIDEIKSIGKEPVVSLLCGANNKDMWGPNPIAYGSRLEAVYNGYRARGAKVVAHTLTAYDGLTAQEQSGYASLNNIIRDLRTAGKADALADHAAGPMGTWNSARFDDFVHPNDAGTTIMAQTTKDAEAPLFPDRL